MSPQQSRYLTSRELCKRADVTYRQLDYWTRMGVLEPILPSAGYGYARRWDETEVAVVEAVAEAVAAGQGMDACRALAQAVRAGHEAVAPALEGLRVFQAALKRFAEGS